MKSRALLPRTWFIEAEDNGVTIPQEIRCINFVGFTLTLYPQQDCLKVEAPAASGAGQAEWGDITGTITAQADLQSALDAKASSSSLATVAVTGAYTDLVGKPTLFDGAYSSLSGVPSTFSPIIGAGATQACAGNDARLSDARTPTAHTQAASTLSDSTATGRAVITAADAAAARTAIGAGTSSFSGDYNALTNKPTLGGAAALNVGTAAGTVAAGDHTHAGGGGFVGASARLTANRTTTSTAMANITDLAIAMAASETWSFECELHAGCNNTGGSQFSVSVPAGATVKVRAFGNTNAATAWTSGQISASDGASPTLLNVSAQGRCVRLSGLIVNGANAGNIQARFKSVTSGQTTTVEANSYMTGRKH